MIMEQEQQIGKEWLEKLLTLMGFAADVKVEYRENELERTQECWLIIDETQLPLEKITMLLGERGEGIDAIQYLANSVIHLKADNSEQQGFTVELNGYRLQRLQQLRTLTEDIAQKVRQTGQEIEMTALSSAERRQIHSFFKDVQDIATESRGQEPHRSLIVKPRY
ncbi:protein jag [Crocosphaera watsonii WH 8501]|uniref:Single-stranded nucleic acid binding R3H n=6 Tax=Crocosphaera watsonii TaxID=263511 RepID=Q4C5Y6_CROWT|nr:MULTISPECIES: R3H domain-containing nucleic acid-binding protein [Crocosphaera]EAM51643.1 Single-stranded nucleic acid binding R3H [Crocosphaera watsonii WH 8501]EHJ13499.1 Jag protein [Crocosphaera watsonii WH 0003]MCH2245046.1 RNA-binding protein [Crocosphaera sp.]NQZ64367.1 RNA-binding protein [Crocosphaera sp.]CCQ51564.1 RNA-binding protein Jag [Crocosphaera watsonii WH 8502]